MNKKILLAAMIFCAIGMAAGLLYGNIFISFSLLIIYGLLLIYTSKLKINKKPYTLTRKLFHYSIIIFILWGMIFQFSGNIRIGYIVVVGVINSIYAYLDIKDEK